MSIATRLIALLDEQSVSLKEHPGLAEQARVTAIALMGSLARDDFRTGGSDVDLMVVHAQGEKPAAELGRMPAMRKLIGLFGEPLLRIGRGCAGHRPLVVDCHFVDSLLLATQPRWAEPSRLTAAQADREPYLWVYAFDLTQHARPLYGPHPAAGLQCHEPAAYLPVIRQWLQERLRQWPESDSPTDAMVEYARAMAWALLTALALGHGGRSMVKHELYRDFNLLAPSFAGKAFAASLWAEYLYGSVFQDRADWLQRCRRFCESGLEVL